MTFPIILAWKFWTLSSSFSWNFYFHFSSQLSLYSDLLCNIFFTNFMRSLLLDFRSFHIFLFYLFIHFHIRCGLCFFGFLIFWSLFSSLSLYPRSLSFVVYICLFLNCFLFLFANFNYTSCSF